MQINLTTPALDVRGKQMMLGNDGAPATLRDIYVELLGSSRAATGTEALQLSRLGQRILDSGEVFDASDADVVLLRAAIEQNAPGFISMAIAAAIEPLEPAG